MQDVNIYEMPFTISLDQNQGFTVFNIAEIDGRAIISYDFNGDSIGHLDWDVVDIEVEGQAHKDYKQIQWMSVEDEAYKRFLTDKFLEQYVDLTTEKLSHFLELQPERNEHSHSHHEYGLGGSF